MVELSWNRNPVPESRSTRMKPMAPPPPPVHPLTPQSQAPDPEFEACASTASLFLYAQGSAIVCLHHDTLALERRFENHQANVCSITVDNVSERGAGRLVVSYDVGQTAIVWDLFTGSVIARFPSFEELRVAAWMRNGNVAFGNGKGDVILFEPSTSEHISCHTIFDPITSLAPASDCRTYAIGYQNGSIMIATLHPTFSVLHTMSTSRGPSPIISLAWHASSSKQKSDMLASFAANGDLRVWSVAKPPAKDSPRTIRVLKRADTSPPTEPKWMAWSKNGKIVQFLDGETWAWDVKTKHVTYEPVPTIENPRGFANYGPTATLFTLGPDYTVQQYDVDNPAIVANVQHVPVEAMSAMEESRARAMSSSRTLQDAPQMRESGAMPPSRRTPYDSSGIEAVRQQRAEVASPVSSSHSRASSKASSGRYRTGYSPPSRSGHTGTSFSLASASERDTPQASQASFAYAPSVSVSSVKSSRAGSRLRNEVQFSPADKSIDLFPFTRARLNDVPYGQHRPLDESHLNPNDLRCQMLSLVFGWDGDIMGLIEDELSRHPPGSHSAVLLAQWLGQSDTDYMVSMMHAGPATINDWMLLAFSQMSGESQANKVGQAFVQKLLESGDIHTAASILLGLGDKMDAIEVYVTQNFFMEAILMTCLVMPTDWQRQSFLVRRWGEHVVSHSQQQLAIRCFMCTGVESSEPWASPAAQQAASFAEAASGRSPITSPEPYANPANVLGQQNSQPSVPNNKQPAKTPALKLITSFDSQSRQKSQFPGLKSDDRTPTNAPGVTPIAESAVAEAMSPGGFGFRMNNIQSINNAVGSRTGTPGFNRHRLPSIGETPVDVHPPTFPPHGYTRAVEYSSTSENEDSKESQEDSSQGEQLGLLPSATYDPNEPHKPSPQTAVQAKADKFASIKGLPSPAPGVFEALQDRSHSQNGSRDRKPDGLQLHLDQVEQETQDRGEQLSAASYRSPATTPYSYASTRSPSVSGRSIDPFISSLDEASYHARRHKRSHGHSRRNTDETASQASTARYHSRTTSQEGRGRMPTDEAAQYAGAAEQQDDPRRGKNSSRTRSSSKVQKPRSRNSSERRHNRSSSRHTASRRERGNTDTSGRGRSVDRQESTNSSPSSPVPLSAATADDALRFVAGDRERRQRSSSRRPDKSARRDPSAEGRRTRTPSHSRPDEYSQTSAQVTESSANESSQDVAPLLPGTTYQPPAMTTEERNMHSATVPAGGLAEKRRKELAAAELEARRLSLARNPSAPNIPFPGEAQPSRGILESPPYTGGSFGPRTPGRRRVSSRGSPPEYRSSSDSNSSGSGPAATGLPTTPRTMRQHPKYNSYEEAVPSVPDGGAMLLSDARYQQDEAERIGRSMSVPVPDHQTSPIPPDIPTHPRFNPNLPRSRSTSRTRNLGHRRDSTSAHSGYNSYGNSPVTVSIEETIENAMHENNKAEHSYPPPPPPPPPPILPELQHLNTPPPPPPFPHSTGTSPRASSGTIDIAIDNENMGRLLPRAMTAAPALNVETRSPLGRRMSLENHRRGKSVNESFTAKIRNLTRMGSASRGSDSWSPPEIHHHVPYESVSIGEGRI